MPPRATLRQPGCEWRSSRLGAAGQSLTKYRHYALHGFLLSISVVGVFTAIVDRVTDIRTSVASRAPQESVAETRAGYLQSPALVDTVPSLLARHGAEVKATAVPSPTATPAAGVASTPEATPQPAFFLYTIQPGDNISSIAAAFGIDPQYILWNNPEVSADPDQLLPGETLVLPSVNGIVYNVRLGDTLTDIASYYQIDVQSIAAYSGNGLSSPDSVIEGMVLVLPGGVPPPPPPPVFVEDIIEDTGGGDASDPVPAGNPQPPSATGYIWPFYGNISQYFGEATGYGYHSGIDIDGFNSYGAPIAAAADGQVVLAAWDDYGLGYHVIIAHADGSSTVYGHLSDIWASQGEYVSQGQAIGALGSSGYSTGPHLHFELLMGGALVDPLAYLP